MDIEDILNYPIDQTIKLSKEEVEETINFIKSVTTENTLPEEFQEWDEIYNDWKNKLKEAYEMFNEIYEYMKISGQKEIVVMMVN